MNIRKLYMHIFAFYECCKYELTLKLSSGIPQSGFKKIPEVESTQLN